MPVFSSSFGDICKEFAQKYSQEWKLCETTKKGEKLPTLYLHTTHIMNSKCQIESNLHLVEGEDDIPILEETDSTLDKAIAPASEDPHELLTYQVDIVWHEIYDVPVIFFLVYNGENLVSNMDVLFSLIPQHMKPNTPADSPEGAGWDRGTMLTQMVC
eukprot:TRINITY_DN17894_c0_g1_i2.p1 TRINITY_DN17894_c0_g1~~TRINITY_DN17894_c0_g1_i2.p1  ORF type:complete len:167 (-),score=21.50 TRINITY_DN17894_c0_g1_i2:285-758(-)